MKGKRLDFELMRLIAIFLVIFNHSQERGFELYEVAGGSTFNNVASLLMAIVCKIAVPLFLMISGGLLLHKEEPLREVLFKRFGRIACVLLIFSGLHYCFQIRWGVVEEPSFTHFFRMVWSDGVCIPYWYLYAYGALMLMLPLLRSMVRSLSTGTFGYLLILHIVYQGIIGPVGYLMGLGTFYGNIYMPGADVMGNYYFPLVEQTLFYFLMGYYFAHRHSWELVTKKSLTLMAVVSVGTVFCTFTLIWNDFFTHGAHTQDFFESLLCIPVFTVYMLAHQICQGKWTERRGGKLVRTLGGCVFGAYLLEGILRVELGFVYESLAPKIHVLPACMIWVLAVGICGLLITWCLKKIPVIRKLL